jgi:tetratricopeptide (TPR) repeat protein
MRMRSGRSRKEPATPFERGLEATASRRYEDAIRCFSEAADADERTAEALSKRGVCKLRLGDVTGATADFEAALRVDPKCAQALTNLGSVALEAGRLDEARAHYEAAIASDPEYPLAHHNFAVLLKRTGDIDGSVRELRRATKLEAGSFWDWVSGRRRR